MRKIIDNLLNMVYPMLISLFIFCFVEAFVSGDYREPLQLISAVLTVLFGVIFAFGFVCNIIHSTKCDK